MSRVQELTRYCPVCGKNFRLKARQRGYSPSHPVLAPFCTRPCPNRSGLSELVDRSCYDRIKRSEIVYKDVETGKEFRFYRRASAHVKRRPRERSSRGASKYAVRIVGIHAREMLPEGVCFVYDGEVLDEYDLKFLLHEHGIVLSNLYAHGGPRERGIKFYIFGQFAPVSTVASYINAAMHVEAEEASNCAWGSVRITAEHLERYPTMQRVGMQVGEYWPCIRTMREIQANEELLVSSYGSGFWQRYERESDWERWEDSELYRLSFFQPRLAEILQARRRQTEEKVRVVASRAQTRGGMKRARD